MNKATANTVIAETNKLLTRFPVEGPRHKSDAEPGAAVWWYERDRPIRPILEGVSKSDLGGSIQIKVNSPTGAMEYWVCSPSPAQEQALSLYELVLRRAHLQSSNPLMHECSDEDLKTELNIRKHIAEVKEVVCEEERRVFEAYEALVASYKDGARLQRVAKMLFEKEGIEIVFKHHTYMGYPGMYPGMFR